MPSQARGAEWRDIPKPTDTFVTCAYKDICISSTLKYIVFKSNQFDFCFSLMNLHSGKDSVKDPYLLTLVVFIFNF